MTFETKTGSAVQIQHDNYYPFGMEMNTKLPPSPTAKNEYLYNRKELQEETQQYDYGARFYEPVIARWNTIDPLAEKSRRWSPYNYVMNNPVRLVDLDGMDAADDLAQKLQNAVDDANIAAFVTAAMNFKSQPGASKNDQEPDQQTETLGSDTSSKSHGNKGTTTADESGPKKVTLKDMKDNPPNVPGFIPPKRGNKKVKLPNGDKGWLDKDGDVWVPDDHKGTHDPHWDVQDPRTGKYYRVFPPKDKPKDEPNITNYGSSPQNDRGPNLVVPVVVGGVLTVGTIIYYYWWVPFTL